MQSLGAEALENQATEDFHNARPKLRDGLRFIPKTRVGGDAWFRIEDERMRRFHRVGVAEYEFLLTLNGERTLGECRQICASASNQQRVLTAQRAEDLVMWAASQSLIEGQYQSLAKDEQSIRGSLAWLKVPLFHRDTNWEPLVRLLGPLFDHAAICVSVFLWLVAITMVTVDSDRFVRDLASIFQPDSWMTLTCVWFILKIAHEAGHLACCRRYGGRVEEAGIAWMLIAPVAYVDLTDLYRIPSRRQRVMTCLAGVYVELTIAALAIVCWWGSISPSASHFLVTTAMTASVASILFNLNPLMRLDGYHALCDWLDRPNLGNEGARSFQSVASLVFFGRRHLQEPMHMTLAAYGFAVIVYRFVISFGVIAATYAFYGPVVTGIVVLALLISVFPQVLKGLTKLSQECRRRPAVCIRIAVVLVWVGTFGASVFQVHRSLQSGWYGVVEYEDDSPVRCASPGRAIRVLFNAGDDVIAGQPLLELENLSVHADRVAAECELQLGVSRWNRYRELHLSAEAASEKKSNDAIAARLEHLIRQEQGLVICAPRSGRTIAMDPENWVGRWFEEGDALLYVVDETKKKVIVAIPQGDSTQVVAVAGSHCEVTFAKGKTTNAVVSSIARQAELTPPHPAMTAIAGGRLAVRSQQKEENVSLVTPHLRLEALITDPANVLRAGQAVRMVAGSRPSI